MTKKNNYKTKWRDEIEVYFKENEGEHVTATDLYGYFREKGFSIGMTTVYRQLDNLVNEGLLNKYTIETGSPACYEFVKTKDSEKLCSCFHCKCEICGKLIHMHCDELKSIQSHLLEHHDFKLNPLRTVFYGICKECRQEKQGEKCLI